MCPHFERQCFPFIADASVILSDPCDDNTSNYGNVCNCYYVCVQIVGHCELYERCSLIRFMFTRLIAMSMAFQPRPVSRDTVGILLSSTCFLCVFIFSYTCRCSFVQPVG